MANLKTKHYTDDVDLRLVSRYLIRVGSGKLPVAVAPQPLMVRVWPTKVVLFDMEIGRRIGAMTSSVSINIDQRAFQTVHNPTQEQLA